MTTDTDETTVDVTLDVSLTDEARAVLDAVDADVPGADTCLCGIEDTSATEDETHPMEDLRDIFSVDDDIEPVDGDNEKYRIDDGYGGFSVLQLTELREEGFELRNVSFNEGTVEVEYVGNGGEDD